MKERISLQLILSVRAESTASNDPLCVHNSIIRETLDPENLAEAKKSLLALLYDTADIVRKIGDN